MIYLIADIIANPGKEKELESSIFKVMIPTRKEAGCIQYDLHKDVEYDGKYIMYEIWASQEAIDSHVASEHVKVFLNEAQQNGLMKDLIINRCEKL
ncbi:antibiotic biosynthesis monooxygenase family protein [Vibrio penaeicida]|uniref:putative quinol monooxygenase n=1 Tax=Vibrio penaeicida TaxID=104609 RepID=UPI00273671AE|nr:antibiotic biosynthesis monooxygenase family protein [Vibrio penaeicida]MDP2574563.1 antibiotic biosynthesis monooxygenase family protein [Vibrio penaeicida]